MTKDGLIQILIDKYNNSSSNVVKFSIKDIEAHSLIETDVIRMLKTLESDNFLSIKSTGDKDRIIANWELTLSSKCIEYFNDKKLQAINSKRAKNNEIRVWIALIFSLIAIIISIIK